MLSDVILGKDKIDKNSVIRVNVKNEMLKKKTNEDLFLSSGVINDFLTTDNEGFKAMMAEENENNIKTDGDIIYNRDGVGSKDNREHREHKEHKENKVNRENKESRDNKIKIMLSTEINSELGKVNLKPGNLLRTTDKAFYRLNKKTKI